MKKESSSPVWLKGMSAWEFEAWWSGGRINKEWDHLNESQQARAKEIKSLFKMIATEDNVDRGLIFELMSLARDLYMELAERQAYHRGSNDKQREMLAEFLQAMKTMTENPLAIPFKPLVLPVEPMLTVAQDAAKRRGDEFLQEVRKTAVKTRDPQTFLNSLICLDSMPGKKRSKHLRNFFACLFAEYLKRTGNAGLVKSVSLGLIEFCFREKMNPVALRRARADFDESFSNWPGIVKRLLKALKAPQVKPSKL